MKKYLLPLLICLPFLGTAHGGDDHGDAKKAATVSVGYFSSETSSEKYELLLKYGTIEPGKPTTFKLFVSDFASNRPLDTVQVKVNVAGQATLMVTVKRIEPGVFELQTTLPEKKSYNFIVNIDGPSGVDLLQLNGVETGKELTVADTHEEPHTHWYTSNLFFGLMGLLAGVLVMFLLHKRRYRKITTTTFILLFLLPTATYNAASAHGGDDHGEGKTPGGGSSTAFAIEKETQFLFTIQTKALRTANFNESVVLLGTVVAAPQGKAVIQSPQAGKITSLRVTPGQQVTKGQVVAVIEQQVDAGTQISISAQSNAVNAEYQAARAQYERLKSIEDIAAKKDVTEARARFEAASKNKALFDANTGRNTGSTKLITLTAPVSGVVGTFNYAIGAVVGGGETLLEITNLQQVYVEGQVFSGDVAKMQSASGFSTNANTTQLPYRIVLKSTAQSVNTGNQSQKVLFEIVNPQGQFKIGEQVNVRMIQKAVTRQLVIPNEAITDVNGKPAVFIKDKAEQYSISFIVKEPGNDSVTVIRKGAEEGERIVVRNVYQMKMMYLNQ